MYKAKILGILLGSLILVLPCFAQQQETITISAEIPSMEGLSVAISQVDPSTDPHTWTPAESIDFGTLEFDDEWGIFRANYYYAVDVGVNTNAASWTLDHIVGTISDGAGHNLDDNISVTFMQQLDDYTFTDLGKYRYSQASRSFTRGQISPGWLRIYYGIATGNDQDPAEVITMAKPAGTYSGTITLSLTIQ